MNAAASTRGQTDGNRLAEQRTDFALERTVMAADRTLLAWVRSAISMIGFGFTIYKFLQYMVQEGGAPRLRIQGPRNLALAFIALGIFSLAIAVVQNRQHVRRMCGDNAPPPWRLTVVVAGAVALIGILAFMNVLFRIGPF